MLWLHGLLGITHQLITDLIFKNKKFLFYILLCVMGHHKVLNLELFIRGFHDIVLWWGCKNEFKAPIRANT